MWTLFTAALARGNSTTQVSIMNTSSNFFITAVLGFAIFSEALPPLWWAGAALLVAGNVIIGRKDEGGAARAKGTGPDEEERVEGGDAGPRPLPPAPVLEPETDRDGEFAAAALLAEEAVAKAVAVVTEEEEEEEKDEDENEDVPGLGGERDRESRR